MEGAGNSNSSKEYLFTDQSVGTRLPAVDNNYKDRQAGLSVQSTPGGVFLQYRIKQIDNDGQFKYSDVVEVEFERLPEGKPERFELFQNYPNPFNPSTTIKFGLPVPGNVTIEVFNMLGQRVAQLLNERKEAGYYQVQWSTNGLASGIYIYRINAKAEGGSKDFSALKKCLLIK